MLREAFATEGTRLPDGTDAVVVARQDARALAEREGLSGVRTALAELIARAAGTEEVEDPQDESEGSAGEESSNPARQAAAARGAAR